MRGMVKEILHLVRAEVGNANVSGLALVEEESRGAPSVDVVNVVLCGR